MQSESFAVGCTFGLISVGEMCWLANHDHTATPAGVLGHLIADHPVALGGELDPTWLDLFSEAANRRLGVSAPLAQRLRPRTF